jgi:hypothetical protein
MRQPYGHSARCVNCGRDKDQHESGTCPGSAAASGKTFLSPAPDAEAVCESCGHPQRYHIKGGCVKQTGSRESSYWPGEREAVLCSCKREVKP